MTEYAEGVAETMRPLPPKIIEGMKSFEEVMIAESKNIGDILDDIKKSKNELKKLDVFDTISEFSKKLEEGQRSYNRIAHKVGELRKQSDGRLEALRTLVRDPSLDLGVVPEEYLTERLAVEELEVVTRFSKLSPDKQAAILQLLE